MKKLLILSLFVSLISCSKEDSILDLPIEKHDVAYTKDVINRRSFEEVVEIAQKSISILQNNNTETRSKENIRTLDLTNGVKAICKPTTRSNSGDSINDTLVYVLNFKDNQGFAVVSASRQTDGLIAVTESGHYDPSTPTGIPGFDSYMARAYDYVSQESQKNVIAETRASSYPLMVKPVYDTIYYKKINPKIEVRWGQGGRMGQFCCNGLSGCVNTAAAQVMSYFKYPYSISLSYSGRDVDSTPLCWTAMCAHQYTNVANNRDNADIQIGRLARQLGSLTISTYNEGETLSSIGKARLALLLLGYNVGDVISISPTNGVFADSDMYPFASFLAQNRLILMAGCKAESNKGHAWVIDGCLYVKALHRLMATYDGTTWSVFQELGTDRTCLNHINWGWNGLCNGYFNGWIYDANNAEINDSGVGVDSGTNSAYVKDFEYFTVTH